jgi:uncharacterized protein YxjI
MSHSTELPALYRTDRFLARRKILTLVGAAFHVFDEDGELLAYSRQKAFKLKEDIRIYADEGQSVELLTIQADRVIDFSAAYSVIDATTGRKVGSLRRKGMASLMRDTWEILDDAGRVRGRMLEDSAGLAILRRLVDFMTLLIPQKFRVEFDGRPVASIVQQFNPFVHKYTVELLDDGSDIPRPLLVASAILLLAIEGRQG